jgi:hypothetical protein
MKLFHVEQLRSGVATGKCSTWNNDPGAERRCQMKMFHVEQLRSGGATGKCSTWNNDPPGGAPAPDAIVPRGTIRGPGLPPENVPRGTMTPPAERRRRMQLFHVEQLRSGGATGKCSTWNNAPPAERRCQMKMFHVEQLGSGGCRRKMFHVEQWTPRAERRCQMKLFHVEQLRSGVAPGKCSTWNNDPPGGAPAPDAIVPRGTIGVAKEDRSADRRCPSDLQDSGKPITVSP